MPYRYLAYDVDGNLTRGTLYVENEETAERLLWERELTVAQLKSVGTGLDLAKWFPTYFGPKRRDIIVFSNQLANLAESGIAIVPALELLAEETSSKALGKVLREVLEEVRQGSAISTALEAHPTVFPTIYYRMIQVGERTGNLSVVLRQLAIYLEKEAGVVQKIRSAMLYPAFIISLAFVVIGILINFTLPPLLSLYEEFDAQIPTATRMLLWISDFTLEHRFHIFFLLAILVIGGSWYVSTEPGRRQWDTLLLKVPLLGRINIQGNVARLSRTLSTLLRAGLQLPESMELTQQTIRNVLLARALSELRLETLQGRGIARPISRMTIFPRMLAQVVRIGEETGTLDSHLENLARFYEEEVDRGLKTITTLIEPALIIFVGLIVAFVAISVILPMYTLLGQIG